MRNFILKHKHTIIYWSFLLFLVLYFAPRQNEFYLAADIRRFEKQYIVPFLICTWISISIILCKILFYRNPSILKAFAHSLFGSLTSAALLFIFKGQFLAGGLFLNRQFPVKPVTRVYTVYSLDEKKGDFLVYNYHTREGLLNDKLIRKFNKTALKHGDTIHYTFQSGLFGVPYLK